MRNIMLCEGSTDFVLLQYFMRKAHKWDDSNNMLFRNNKRFNVVRTFVKDKDTLTIAGMGGCSKILLGLEYLLELNRLSSGKDEAFQKIVLIVDRDEVTTEEDFKLDVEMCLNKYNVSCKGDIVHNNWFNCSYRNARGQTEEVNMLLLIVPFEETGALETFLLNAVAKNDSYDACIIQECNRFVDNIDYEKRYLNKRRYITKAKFDVYFSVRTAAEQFVERQNILKNIEWEKYLEIQTSFAELGKL